MPLPWNISDMQNEKEKENTILFVLNNELNTKKTVQIVEE